MGAGKYKMYDTLKHGCHPAKILADPLRLQPHRLANQKIKHQIQKTKEGKSKYVYINNTVIASPRILIAIWKTTNKDGSVIVPQVCGKQYLSKGVIKKS